jgi:hypothetical protein
MTVAPHSGRSNSEGKTTSSFLADDVLQGPLHADARSHFTTTGSPYDGGYDSYFDGDDFGGRTVTVRKKLSFNDVYRSATERMDYHTPLTTPRISLFDDIHAKVTEGIRQNLEEMDEYMFGDSSRFYGDNVQEGHRTVAVTALPPPSGDPEDKGDEQVALEFLSKLSVTYNDSKMSNSVRRDIVVENGTHIDFERSSIHTELTPDTNRTTYYITNDTHSTIIPAPTAASKANSKNVAQNSDNEAVFSELSLESLKNSEHTSPHPDIAIRMNVIPHNTTGTPGNKDSTTSGSKRGPSFSRSNDVRSNSSREIAAEISNKAVTPVTSNETKSRQTNPERRNSTNETTTRNGSKWKPADAVSAERLGNRGGRLLVASRSNYSSTNGLEQSSEASLSRTADTNLGSHNTTKRPRVKLNLRRSGTNVSDEQTETSTVTVGMTTGTTGKAPPSVRVRGIESTSPQTSSSVKSRRNDTNGVTVAPMERPTTAYTSFRARNFTYQRPHTSATNRTGDIEAKGGTVDSTTARPSTSSSSVGIEMLRRRLTTLNRRLQSSTASSVPLSPRNASAVESNAIVRGLPAIAGRAPPFNNTQSNKTENNERNDIVSFKSEAFKPVTRSRGSVRYGNHKNGTSGDTTNSSSVVSTPPSIAAWTLVSLKRPSNETRNQLQVNSTSETHTRRWPPIRGRRPWTSEEQGKYLCLKKRNGFEEWRLLGCYALWLL